ncbi:hypothetical protein V6N13_120679 [Hibiscus sabdariffa]
MKTRVPVFVIAFNPLCRMVVAALGSAVLDERIHLGSMHQHRRNHYRDRPLLHGVGRGKGNDFSPPSAPAKDYCNLQELPISEKYCANATKFAIATIDTAQQSGK